VKKSQMSEIIVGLVFVTGVALLGTYTIAITKLTWGDTKQYKVIFREGVFGLREGDAVRVEGFEVGEVKSLRPHPDGGIVAVLQVDDEVKIYRTGSSIRVTPFSPLGGRVVEIERGKDADGPQSAADEFPYFGSAEGAVDDPEKVPPIQGDSEGELLQTLNRLVEDNRESVNRIVNNLDTVSKQLTKTDNILGYLINSQEGQRRIDGVVTSMNSSAQRLERIMANIESGQGVIGGLVAEKSELGTDVTLTVASARSAFTSASNILRRADEGKSGIGVLVSEDPTVSSATRGIVADVKTITGRIAEGKGTLGKLSTDDRLYQGAASTAENLAVITERVQKGHGVFGVLTEEKAGDDVRAILGNVADISRAVNDPQAGTLGLLVHDDVLRNRISRIGQEIERLAVEFRDSLEDTREQAPVNAFIGAVFAAF
jgi:phospholipid/cholesterol/gamma-HCH transport system substrate-binding protein